MSDATDTARPVPLFGEAEPGDDLAVARLYLDAARATYETDPEAALTALAMASLHLSRVVEATRGAG